jgi:tRNA (guanine-N7-)-methyltransferase
MRDQSPSAINKDINQSGIVSSSQRGTHPRLEDKVRKHLARPWEQPLHTPSVEAYRQLSVAGVFDSEQPIILDSGCGTGKSSQMLAKLFPEHLVLGVDRSLIRLSRSGLDTCFYREGNCVLVRAELTTFWRLMLADGFTPEQHFLLYPNPYPKPGHLSRRWHGHPVFPQLLHLGGDIELRCNWKTYALEFAGAVSLACGVPIDVMRYEAESGISLFEQKYLQRGQKLYSVKVPAQVAASCLKTGQG